MKKDDLITEPIFLAAARLQAIADKYIFFPVGLSCASMKVLQIIQEKGPLNSGKIMDIIGGSKSNLSQRLDYLEKHGYIKKNYASIADDKRKVVAKITNLGRKKLFLAEDQMKKAKLCLNKHFTREEIDAHLHFFKKINQIIDQEEINIHKIIKK